MSTLLNSGARKCARIGATAMAYLPLRRVSISRVVIPIVVTMLLPWSALGSNLVSSNVLTRLLRLRLGDQQATGFTIEVDKRQYVITARHFADSAPAAATIDVYRNSKWTQLPFGRLAVEPATVDIAVLVFTQPLSSVLPVEVGFRGTTLSQTVFFLGFPLGLSIDGNSLNSGYPLPLVKHGIVAALEVGGR